MFIGDLDDILEGIKRLEYKKEIAILDLTEEIAKRKGKTKLIHWKDYKRELARRFDCSLGQVTKILQGDAKYDLERIVKWADALDCDVKIVFVDREQK